MCSVQRTLQYSSALLKTRVRVSSLVLSFSLSFSLSLESKVNAKVVSKLSRERVLWRKVFRVFDGVPQRERERAFSHNARGKARPRATLLRAAFVEKSVYVN